MRQLFMLRWYVSLKSRWACALMLGATPFRWLDAKPASMPVVWPASLATVMPLASRSGRG